MRVLFVFLFFVPGSLLANGCEAPAFRTSNGVEYMYQFTHAGKIAKFKRGDSVYFRVSNECRAISKPIVVSLNDTVIGEIPFYFGYGRNFAGRAGHYVVTTEWDYWRPMRWEFDMIEEVDTVNRYSPPEAPETRYDRGDNFPRLLFDPQNQTFRISGTDTIASISIRNTMGMVVLKINDYDNSLPISVADLPRGLMITEIRSKSEKIYKKSLFLN
jgi:hypothetical protein